jgi:hypothetical protein
MNGKIEFGCDFLALMRSLAFKGNKYEVKPVNEAVANLFLVEWGLTLEETAAANNLFFNKMNAGEYNAPLINIARRIVDQISINHLAPGVLIIQMAALGAIDFIWTDEEKAFISIFQQLLNIGPLDFQALTAQGATLALALNNFGRAYMASA